MEINMGNKAILFVKYYSKIADKLVQESEIMTKITKKEFLESLAEDEQNGFQHEIKYVMSKPKEFQLGIIYVLNVPGRPTHIYTHQLDN